MTIEVIIRHLNSKTELARITIENVETGDEDSGNYSVRFSADRAGGVGIHQRALYGFPRLRYNVLALVLQALHTLDPRELELEDGTGPSDLARGQRGLGRKVQKRAR